MSRFGDSCLSSLKNLRCTINHTFRIFRNFCARMTHFGEIIELLEDDPVNLMLPSDSIKIVSIVNYRPRKFQSYENFTILTQGKKLDKFHHQNQKKYLLYYISTPNSLTLDHNTIYKIVIKP